jgi:hypothetical protein
MRSTFGHIESGDENFIPISNAKVFCLVTGNVLFESEFLAVIKNILF